ncbi:MAG: T9SS type A sorting domain-containing protein [Melioribacteraceae bacterium]|nr:T9SS type A sorting domain-containing protein [Melioribacteraceae bacterium]
MKLYNSVLKTLTGLLFVSSTLFAQLELSVYTDKDSYQYGEQIELFCKVTNNADTTFQFFASYYQTCQAEFSFNDFNSWEHTICLATTELLTFKPHSSKIYSWKIDPVEYGLPNNEGNQMIIGKYYFGLVDTIYINAPQYLGGRLSVGFLPANSDSVQSIKDSLNVTVLNHSDYGTTISETWQIEGFQIDSIITYFQIDSILTYVEKALLVGYDKIIDEDPFEYYPLDIGNYWEYDVRSGPDPYHTEYRYSYWVEVVGDTILNNGKTYKILLKGYFNDSSTEKIFERIDSSTSSVFRFENEREYKIDSLACSEKDTILSSRYSEGNNGTYCKEIREKEVFGKTLRVKHLDNFVYIPNTEYELANGIGLIANYSWEMGSNEEYLQYARIKGKEYGTRVDVEMIESIPKKFSLSQNYPNPFNPSTTIKYSIPSVQTPLLGGVGGGLVTLKVYDILGREVATLVNKEQKPGNYEVQFSASSGANSARGGLTTGVYFYRLHTSTGFIESRKMVLIK